MKVLGRIILAGALASLFSLAPPLMAHERMQHKKAPETGGTAAAAPDAAARAASNMTEISMFLSNLKKPEYIHVLINPVPIFGMGLGLLFLFIAWFRPAEGLATAGLVIVIATGLVTYPTVNLGQKAYDRMYETLPLEGQMWLDVHMDRAEKFQYLFYLAAALAGATLWTRKNRPVAARRLMLATMASSGLCAAVVGLIAHAGGKVNHPEFREGPPPAGALKKAPPAPGRNEESGHAH